MTFQMQTIQFILHFNKNSILRIQKFNDLIVWFIIVIKIFKRSCKIRILISKQRKKWVNSKMLALVTGPEPNTGKLLMLCIPMMIAYPFLGNWIGEILAGFKFCSGNARSWKCCILRKVPVSGFHENQRQHLRPSVISRMTQKSLVLAERCSCLSSPTLRLKNKQPCQQIKS